MESPSDLVVPGARALLESLRGVGYSPWTAMADLVDNSIAAGARRIYIDFVWRGRLSYVRILDNGFGMDEATLTAAMRPGSRSPMEVRSADDLGRFGLGLKTASLSQCRVLTVASKRGGRVTSRRWDLDYIAQKDEWRLLIGPPEEVSEETLIPEEFPSGTLVLWTNLDRLLGSVDINDTAARDRFFETARLVEKHLAMTFHRFLEGPRPRLELFLNGTDREARIRPWDPFMQNHPATIVTPEEPIADSSGGIEVQGFVLPHKDMLTPEEFDSGGGPDGWLAHQGFFIYRNQRLLVSGGWLALGSGKRWVRDEIHRLARIRVDLANSADHDWKIDIKKSVAIPPPGLRPRLRGLAERVRVEAREVFAHRGGRSTRSSGGAITRAWISVYSPLGVSYRIDRAHPSVKRVLDTAGERKQLIEDMLRVIEATVPVQRIWLDTAERGDIPNAGSSEEAGQELFPVLFALYIHMLDDLHLTSQEARARLSALEPFNRHPALIGALPDQAA